MEEIKIEIERENKGNRLSCLKMYAEELMDLQKKNKEEKENTDGV